MIKFCHFTLSFFILIFAFYILLLPMGAEASIIPRAPNNLGLVGYWAFNDGAGTNATDSSGSGNAGTLAASPATPSWTTGKLGKALSFDGSNDYVDVTLAKSIANSPLSACAWIFPTNLTGRFAWLWFTASDLAGFEVGSGSGGTNRLAMDHNAFWAESTNNAVSLNAWNHVCATINGFTPTDRNLYVNGKNVNGTTDSLTANSGTFTTLNIGRRIPGGAAQQFSGLIDEVRVYNRALSAAEVKALYESR